MLMVLPFSAKGMERVSTDLQCKFKLFCTLESKNPKSVLEVKCNCVYNK